MVRGYLQGSTGKEKVVFEIVVLLGQGLFTRKLLGGGGMVFEMVVVLGQEFFTRKLLGGGGDGF